jgi:PAS domain S-box-containing protein
MKDENRTKEQLANELAEMRQWVAEWKAADTERKRAEETLKGLLKQVERAKQEWESTADSLPDLICLVDDQGRVIRANRTVETWNLGRVVDVRGQEFHELLHSDCPNGSCYLDSFWRQAWEEAIRGQAAQCEAYDEILKRYVLIRVQPWKDWGKGTAAGSTVVTVRDITERKRAEEALKEYSERLEEMVDERTRELRDAQERLLRAERLAAIGQLGAGVGHELRNPLGIIKNSAYYLNMKLGHADEKVKKHLGIIEKEITRSNKIITDLMDFARVKRPALRKTDANLLVREAISRSKVPENVEVRTRLKRGLSPLMADPSQIEQVFINVISNAAQAMTSSDAGETGKGGRLEISTRAEDGFIVTEFKDNGCGISEENLGKLFEPLFTTKTKGIGLGLAISKAIVEAHEGRIEVESELGQGTTFAVKLPALADRTQNQRSDGGNLSE